jgi:hypothetical protein
LIFVDVPTYLLDGPPIVVGLLAFNLVSRRGGTPSECRWKIK